ncbi:MAG TPA: sulfur carrier protein ThiS [Bryobacteraceae bacterium]|jgi:sulfur carrier protein|nr:sulfur carrier protein ThiS [Bryobacteraceae bacterium]
MRPELIDIVVNGERKSVASGLTVRRLLDALEIPADRVAVELNKSIVRKRHWEETPVETGAQLEIVQFVGGG